MNKKTDLLQAAKDAIDAAVNEPKGAIEAMTLAEELDDHLDSIMDGLKDDIKSQNGEG